MSPQTRDQHFQSEGPKRILALDGGGIRGILTLGILRAIEETLRTRHRAGPEFRLCHYFDLIAGTSTGAIIAAALAMGLSVEDVIAHYRRLGRDVFAKEWSRFGIVRARYDHEKLAGHLRTVFGDITLGDSKLQTGLLVMAKRLDTGSPWPLGNNPRGRYFRAGPESTWISNGDYPLWQVVRASTAAPSFFDPEPITIATQPGKKDVTGLFVDGGVSPFNNPSLQAVMYATLGGYRVNWPTGADRLCVVSVGTGSAGTQQTPSGIAAVGAMRALVSLMDDCGALVETLMQWLSSSATAREIDSELGTLGGDVVGGTPLVSYARYDVALTSDGIAGLGLSIPAATLARLGAMDDANNLELLLELGTAVGRARVQDVHFDARFDLAAATAVRPGRRQFVKRANHPVVAVQLALETDGFTYRKWGADQTGKPGDWLVNNDGDVYTVDRATFERTYRQVSPGCFHKTTVVWAEVAEDAGSVPTKEGVTHYQAGDYLVFNEETGGDAYAVSKAKFEEMYEPAP